MLVSKFVNWMCVEDPYLQIRSHVQTIKHMKIMFHSAQNNIAKRIITRNVLGHVALSILVHSIQNVSSIRAT